MDEACNLRLQKLELEQQLHKDEIAVLKQNDISILAGLNAINKTMLQVKTAIYTVVIVLVLLGIGPVETLKMLIEK
jgi:hypothetical protein